MSDIEKLRAAFEASIKEEWSLSPTQWGRLRKNIMSGNFFVGEVEVGVDGDNYASAVKCQANAEFIILAHNLMPKILADLDYLRNLEIEFEAVKAISLKTADAISSSDETVADMFENIRQMQNKLSEKLTVEPV